MYFLLDLITVWWVLWPIEIIFVLILWSLLRDKKYCDKFHAAPLVLAVVGGFLLLRKFPDLRHYLWSWKHTGLMLAAYATAGLIISTWKWFILLLDFKKDAPLEIAKASEIQLAPGIDRPSRIASKVVSALGLPDYAIVVEDDKYVLSWKAFPIGTWWTYWPFFILSVVLDPITRLINRFVSWLKSLYHSLARQFAVSVKVP